LEVARKGWENGHRKHGDEEGECQSAQLLISGLGSGDIFVQDLDDNDRVNLTDHSFYEDFPRWSADKSKITYTCRPGSRLLICVMDSAGNIITQCPADGANNWYSSFSPNGNKIAFLSDRQGGRKIFVMDSASCVVEPVSLTPSGVTDDTPV